MRRITLALLALLSPVVALAAPAAFSAERSLLVASSSPGNSYAIGATVTLTAPVAGDFSAAGGSVTLAAPVAGDALLLGGSINERARVGGDARALGGTLSFDNPVQGDLVALGFSVHDFARAEGAVFIAAANTSITQGAGGPVTVYANTVSLAGDFAGNINVVTSGRLTLASSTVIHGSLSYTAPEPAIIPSSVVISGGVNYTNASYLPHTSTSRVLNLASVGVFLLARILGTLILAGLFAGLFPRLAEALAVRAYEARPRSILLTMLLGFAALVAAPVLFVLLLLTFVGVGLALVLLFAYGVLVLLGLLYAGILVGALLARKLTGRTHVLWRDGVFGMLILSILTLVPVVGPSILFLLTAFSTGALLLLFFHFAFPREEQTSEML